MKRILLLSIIAISATCFATELSDAGRAHFKAAMALFEIASSNDDYKQVAQEFETVTKSDPNYPDTYINLCKIYGRIGATDGNIYFTKAKEALEKYHALMPNDIDTYNDEKVILETLQKKYNNSPARFIGKWKSSPNSKDWFVEIQYITGEFSIKINTDGKYEVKKVNDSSYDIIYYLNKSQSEKFVDDCDSHADSGYPTRGKYYYNSWEATHYERLTLTGKVPRLKLYKQHTEYFLYGQKTYSETTTSEFYFYDDDLIKY